MYSDFGGSDIFLLFQVLSEIKLVQSVNNMLVKDKYIYRKC